MFYLLAGSMVFILPVICIVHLFRTGRPFWWLFLILFFPFVGVPVYFLVEILPGLGRNRSVHRLGAQIVNTVDPGRSVRRLEEDVQVSDTVKNRQALAAGYTAAGRHADSIRQYERCLTGIYKDDPPLMGQLAMAQFVSEDFAAAKETLERLAEVAPKFRPPERQLLRVQVLEELGEVDAALELYGPLVGQASGEEARCRHALLLEKVGRTDEAKELFQRILLNAKRSPRYYRTNQREWIRIARQHIR